jgi:hypothetical protein
MIKFLVSSFALGGAGAVLVSYISFNPPALTHPLAAGPPFAAAATPLGVESPRNTIILSEVRITASGKKAQKQTILPAELDPCSEWSDVGAMFIDPAGATGVHRVRTLCEPGDER